MKHAAAAVLAIAAALGLLGCGGFTPFEPAPTGPNNPGGLGDAGPDAPSDASPDGTADNEVTGQLCLVVDLRTPFVCARNIDFAGVEIAQVGTNTVAVADASGAFTLDGEPGQFVVLRVAAGAADDLATTIVRLTQSGLADVMIPVLAQSLADELIANADVATTAGTGQAVFIFSQQQIAGRVPRSDVALTVPGDASALYETLAATEWTTAAGQTGSSGVALAINVASGSRAFSADYSAQTVSFTQVPIEAGAWTFVTGLFAE